MEARSTMVSHLGPIMWETAIYLLKAFRKGPEEAPKMNGLRPSLTGIVSGEFAEVKGWRPPGFTGLTPFSLPITQHLFMIRYMKYDIL
jgi:hypothetical protein